MADGMRPRGGPGCLGVVIGTLVLAAVITLVLLVGIIALGVVAALFVLGLVVVAVDRLLLALSPKRRERRAQRGAAFTWQIGRLPTGPVIDVTAVETPAEDDPRRPDEGGPDEGGPGRSGPA